MSQQHTLVSGERMGQGTGWPSSAQDGAVQRLVQGAGGGTGRAGCVAQLYLLLAARTVNLQ